jgi:histidine triad (HIT) family protein
MQKTLFSRIIDREIPSQIIYENDDLIVIKDINPVAPIHYLIIPKKPVQDMKDPLLDAKLAGAMVKTVQHLAAQLAGEQAFNIVVNNGAGAGQSVPHLHWHFISGRNIHEHGFLK